MELKITDIVPIGGYNYRRDGDSYRAVCHKCLGTGFWNNNARFKCFTCNGLGTVGNLLDENGAHKRSDRLRQEQAIRDEVRRALDERREEEHLARQRERQAKADERQQAWDARVANTEHIGSLGELITVRGRVTTAKSVETVFGTTKLVIVKVSDTVVVKTFSTAGWVWEVEVGAEIELTGSVKSHEDYKGDRTTLLARCKYRLLVPAPSDKSL
jgi:RecJ-like exonuclease